MKRTRDPLELPFIDVRCIIEIFGGVISRATAYNMAHELLNGKDENGKPLIDPARMPPTTKIMVPTDIFCKKYQIKRKRNVKKDTPTDQSTSV